MTGWRRPSKYRNVRVVVDGETYDSKKEARWYAQLRLRERLGDIRNLRRQVRYPLVMAGTRVATYVADAVYEEQNSGTWVTVIADVKSPASRANRVYRLKKKMMAALGFHISEVL
jgi:hypothetical protein